VVYTEVLQAIVLILGSITLMAIGLSRVGGFAGLEAKVPAGFFSMWKPSNHPDFPGPESSLAHQYWAYGIGAPTNTSCSACSLRRTSKRRAPERSSLDI